MPSFRALLEEQRVLWGEAVDRLVLLMPPHLNLGADLSKEAAVKLCKTLAMNDKHSDYVDLIHSVEVDLTAAKQPGEDADTTIEFLRSLEGYPQQLQDGWPTAPDIKSLGLRMEGPLKHKDGTLARLPVADKLYRKLVSNDPQLATMLQPVSKCGAEQLAIEVSAALQHDMPAPGDEIVLAGYVDQLLWQLFVLVGRVLDTAAPSRKRNRTEPTLTSEKLKPDFLLIFQQILMMKGEDKTDDADMNVAKRELRDKLKRWSARCHGQMEYLLCYAAAGLRFQFCALGRAYPHPPLHNLGREWLLSTKSDRVRVMMCALMLFPVIMQQLSQVPNALRGDGVPEARPNGTTITYWDDTVEKTIDTNVNTHLSVEAMKLLYSDVKGCFQLVQLLDGSSVKLVGRTYRVFLVPLGNQLNSVQPPLGSRLRYAIRCVLMAVQWLHVRGWGHGDIRWENIISETEKLFRLIDLESALRLGTDCTQMNPLYAWGDQCAALEQGVFTAKSDLYMIGALMRQASVDDQAGQGLMTALLSKNITVENALAHSWFHGLEL